MAAPKKKPPRAWSIDDLLDLGKRGGVTYVKAIPVLILEKWVRAERQEGVANFIRTKELARRLQSSKLVAGFKPKGTSSVGSVLAKIQSGRNLTDPSLIEYQGGGMYWINLPHYEALLQEYRQEYHRHYPHDYEKLFSEREPEWEASSLPKKQAERRGPKPIPSEPRMQDEIHKLLTPLEQALRDRQQAVERLTEENQKLQA